MRRVPIALALATTLLLGLVAAPAIAASKNQPVGDRISLFDGSAQSYPAGDAFHVAHGFLLEEGLVERAVGKYLFVLEVDGTTVKPNFALVGHPEGFQLDKVWYFNFPAGMSGTHVFTGHWWQPCDNVLAQCNGARPNTPVEIFTLTSTVTFS